MFWPQTDLIRLSTKCASLTVYDYNAACSSVHGVSVFSPLSH